MIKYIIITVLFLFSVSNVNGQDLALSNLDKIDHEFKVYTSDNNVLTGKMKSFKNLPFFRTDYADWSNIDKQTGMMDDRYTLITSNGKMKIELSEVDSIHLNSSAFNVNYYKKNLVTLNDDGEVKKKELMLLNNRVYKGEKINVYAQFFIITSFKGKKAVEMALRSGSVLPVVYLGKNEETDVIKPIDLSIMKAMFKSREKLQKHVLNNIAYIYDDCPEVMKDSEEMINSLTKKDVKQMGKEYMKNYDKKAKEIKKLPKDERGNAWLEYYNETFVQPYIESVKNYENHCYK